MATSNLTMRLLTAMLALPLLLAMMFWGPEWGWVALVEVATAIAALELFAMTHPEDRVLQVVGVVSTVALSLAFYFGVHQPKLLVTAALVFPILGLLVPLWRLGRIETAALRMLAGVAVPFYIGVLLCTIALLRRDAQPYGPHFVLLTLTIAWFGDTGGYFFGRFLGKRKLYEAVSPKKTRAGFLGSLLASALAGAAAHFSYLPALPLAHALALALVAGCLGQLGDLAESLLKRSTGIKDSGSIIPGHGGLLDRVDAVLVAAPVVYLYTYWA